MMERKEVQSSTIRTIGYDSETKTLEVAFSSGGVYEYSDVPAEVAISFLNADSKGRFFQADIRPCYPCHRLHIQGCEGQNHDNPEGCLCWCHRLSKSVRLEEKNHGEAQIPNPSLEKELRKSVKAAKAKKRIS